MTDGPLIVQSDKTLLLEVDHPMAQEARAAIAPFAELERSPEHVHTYRLTPLGLWNARAAGHDAEQVVDTLLEVSRSAVPHALLVDGAAPMAGCGWRGTRCTGWCGCPVTGRCWRRCCAPRRSPGCWGPASMTAPASSTPP